MVISSEDTLRLSRVGAVHGIKKRRLIEGRDSPVATTYCGRVRQVSDTKLSSQVTCRSCQRAMNAGN